MLLCSGQLLIGDFTAGTLEAHLSSLGHTIRMVMGHFVDLKRCPHMKQVAFRKARFYKFGLSVLVLI
jgi:hypothetical protein